MAIYVCPGRSEQN